MKSRYRNRPEIIQLSHRDTLSITSEQALGALHHGVVERNKRLDIPPIWIPTRTQMERFRTTPEMFARNSQVEVSNHNIRHHAGVEIGLILVTAHLEVIRPGFFEEHLGQGFTQEHALELLLRVASVHDTQRFNDDWESLPRLVGNRRAKLEQHAMRLARLLKRDSLGEEEISRADAVAKCLQGLPNGDDKDIVIAVARYHDAVTLKIDEALQNERGFQGNDEAAILKRKRVVMLVEMFKAADNLELVRSHYAYAKKDELKHNRGRDEKPPYTPTAYHFELFARTFIDGVLANYSRKNSPTPEIHDAVALYLPTIATLFNNSGRDEQSTALYPPAANDQFNQVMKAAERMKIFSLSQVN